MKFAWIPPGTFLMGSLAEEKLRQDDETTHWVTLTKGFYLRIHPTTQAQWLREWLEFVPEKVLFGTDGYPFSDEMGWPESTWIANRQARQALGIALTGMLQDHEITSTRARELALMVLHQNAQALYQF